MSTEDIYTLLEIKQQSQAIHFEKPSRTCPFAQISFCLSLLLLPTAAGASFIFETVIYNPPLKALNGLLCYFILIFTPLSVLSAIVAFIRIPLSKNNLKGYRFAIIGVILSVGSFLIAAYFWVTNFSIA